MIKTFTLTGGKDRRENEFEIFLSYYFRKELVSFLFISYL